MSELQAARHFLFQSIEKAQVVATQLNTTHSRLQNIAERLPSLEIVMRPMLEQLMDANKFSNFLDNAMAPGAFILKKYESLRALETKILANPKEDIGNYLLAVSQLEEALHFLSENSNVAVQRLQEAVHFFRESKAADNFRMHRISEALAAVKALESQQQQPDSESLDFRLMNIALKKLQEEFYRLLVENSTVIALPTLIGIHEKPNKISPSLPVPIMQQLQAIFKKMVANGQVDQCAKYYLEVRSEKVRESLLGLQPTYLQLSSVKAVDALDWPTLEGYIGDWTQHFEVAVRVLYAGERNLVKRIFFSVDSVSQSKLFASLAHGGMASFLQFGQSVVRSQKSPKKLFRLLDIFETLQNLDPSIAEVFEGEGCNEIRLRLRELQKQTVHGACQVFKEFGHQLQLQKDGPLPPDGSILKLSSYVVNYTKYLVSEFYGPIMNQVLQIEQSWKNGNVRESGLPQAVLHIMELLDNTILACSKGYKDISLSHIFLMNNYYYMFMRSKGSELGPLLGDSWLKQFRRKVQQQALAYQKEGWGRVLSQLSRDGLFLSTDSRFASRDLVKQRLKAFTSALQETCGRHSKFMIEDADLREGTRLAVIQAIVPAYRSYIQSYGPLIEQGDMSSNKHMTFSAEALEQKLGELYQGRN
ncbi:hypothetical protein O6H91_22G055600 [Diphasiastrum complanatum]|nr:hypothetical protein O6H91_22G055600 [Diphasiastrum complanatum]